MDVFAGFNVHTYYKEQVGPECHMVFMVVTYSHGSESPGIYQASGFVQFGNGCDNKKIIQDKQSVIDLKDVMGITEVHEQIVAYLDSKGIVDDSFTVSSDFSVFCNPNDGTLIVNRTVNSIDQIEIRNLQGEIKKTLSTDLSKTSERYDISDLAPGIYIVCLGKSSIIIHTDQIIR
jgi:hypothetical protein